jgi:hypothetical protein
MLGTRLALAETAKFVLALLDINVGGESVHPVAEAVERRRPILFVSSYKTTGLPPRFQPGSILRKPFTVGEPRKAIETALKSEVK